jgi:4-oxalocrotonate tautomerase
MQEIAWILSNTAHYHRQGGTIIMPIVHIELLEGRSIEQKRDMVKKVTDAIVETTSCPIDAVKIVICEMAKTHFSEGGVLRSDR